MGDHWNPDWKVSHKVAAPVFDNPNPTTDEVREAIAEQICPWCGAGPFRRLSSHTNARHGIDKNGLRDAAFLVRSAVVASQDLTQLLSKHAIQREFGIRYPKAHPGKQSLSPAGLAKKRELGRALKRPTEIGPHARAKLSAFAKSRARQQGRFLPRDT